jgi:murein DD-endopeptidase MepM/ murein hydrolase activator NlpD
MSRFRSSVKNGSKVKQGEIIGYVGKTGLATGPHLHYEFRLNGVHKNPLTVKLPAAEPIEKKYREDFKRISKQEGEALDQLNEALLVTTAGE